MRFLFVLLAGLVTCCASAQLRVDGNHRIAFGSCANPNKGGKIWRLIKSFQPDHLVVLGDVMYTDHDAIGRVNADTPRKIMREYALLSRDQHWRNLVGSVRDFSITYDDHDYGGDNGNKNFPHKDFSQAAFRSFTSAAFEKFRTNSTTAVYSSTTVHTKLGHDESAIDFTYKVVLLDGRSNKDHRGTENGDFLGEEQWSWLAEELLDPSADVILLGSAIQVLGEDQIVEETWSEFPASRKRLLTLVTAASQLTNVVLLSGDVHRAEVSRASCILQAKTQTGMEQVQPAAQEVPLWELTSSGFSHTIMHRTNDSADTSTADHIAVDNTSSRSIPIRLRNPAVLFANHIYELARPAHHRADKVSDVYHGINFGLLDFTLVDKADSVSSTAAVQLEFTIISHEGEAVLTKSIPLRRRAQLAHTGSDTHDLQALREALLHQIARGALDVQCVPYWGAVPLWRTLLYRAMMAGALLLLVVAPLLTVLWFVGASLYYVLRGKELARRDAIEQRYQQLKKQA